MYLIYETYTDETRNMRDLRFNTKVVGLYGNKKDATKGLKKYLKTIQTDLNDNNWFVKQYDKKLMKEQLKNAIVIYEVFNEYINNYEEIFYIIMEKVEIKNEINN